MFSLRLCEFEQMFRSWSKRGDCVEQISALVKVLKDKYPEYPVYTEKVKFTGVKPCFLVQLKESTLKKEINGVYCLTEIFEISYCGKEKNIKKCMSVNEDLDVYLKNIDGVWGKKRKYQVKDGILKVEYEYSARVRLVSPQTQTKMQGIKLGMEMIF